MTDEPETIPPDVQQLTAIAEHLKSIRAMLKFFTVLTVLGLILGACTALTSF